MAETPIAAFFRRMVLGPTGIPMLVKSLDSLLASEIDMDDVKWEDVGLALRALAFLSEHAWVVQGMTDNNEGKGNTDVVEENIKAIMGVFWYVEMGFHFNVIKLFLLLSGGAFRNAGSAFGFGQWMPSEILFHIVPRSSDY